MADEVTTPAVAVEAPVAAVESSSTPVPVVVEQPQPSVADEIAAINKAVEETGESQVSDTPEAVDDDVTEVPDAETAEEETDEKPEDAEDAPETEDSPADEAIVFTDTDTPEEFAEKKKAALDGVDLSTVPEISALIAYQDAQIAKLSETQTELGNIANKDTLVKLGSAMNRLYETEIDPLTGKVTVNTAPIVEFMRTDLREEFRPIAEGVLSSDSMKYQGASIFEELLIDYFGAEKANKMVAYGQANVPLPVIPEADQLPAAVDDRNREAFHKLPEVKRFEIQSLIDDIRDFEEDMIDAPDYRKEEIAPSLRAKREKLDAEIFALEQIQRGYDSTRTAQATAERQQVESNIRFRNQVSTAYNTDLFDLAETFAKDLAPRLTYADADTQLSQARNINSRVNNALGFAITDQGTFAEDPMATFYAKQLNEEGVKYDFNKGRSLLQAYYKSTEKLEALRSRQASPQAIEIATKEKNRLMFDIKTEERQLLGQLSTKYVKSNGAALGKQVDALKAKRQVSRVVSNGHGASGTSRTPIAEEISAHNRRIAAQIANGDELFAAHAGN